MIPYNKKATHHLIAIALFVFTVTSWLLFWIIDLPMWVAISGNVLQIMYIILVEYKARKKWKTLN